jgi:large subunit ribosomal protein L3
VKAILGEKLGMTQVFDDESQAVPVTVIKAGPCRVVQIKTPEADGYGAVQIAYKEMPDHRSTRPAAGHFARAGLGPHRHLVEIRVEDPEAYQVGQEISVGDVLEKGARADVAGVTKGKGFAGVMKRHHFSGQGASHGTHRVHRAPGAIGACATPSRVFKGMKLPGRLGGERRTVLNLEVVEVDSDRGLLMLRGAVPGGKGSVLLVREAVKRRG